MNTQIIVSDKTIELTSRLFKSGVPFPNTDQKDKGLHNEFAITVSRQLENGRVQKTFPFYDSQANYEKGIEDLSEMDLKLAFRAIIDDANCGTMDFPEFCSELGYDEDSRRAEKIHKECKRSLNKVQDLGFFESELSDILNDLQEQGIE